ncbi:hypothetical protein FPQ18DRAFT_416605 [Pyronema domesticum]|nr:hypothetical protein FPQ18DRAFT_416605 [Pyronema domesticum]
MATSSSFASATTAGIVTAASATGAAPDSVMASIPRFFAKMASLGYIGTPSVEDPTTTSAIASAASKVAESLSETLSESLGETLQAAQTNSASLTKTAQAAASNIANTTLPEIPWGPFDGSLRGVGNVFSFVTGKWALLCLCMTILLNRTLIYASLRRPIRLSFKTRLLLRIVPIILLSTHVSHMLFAMRCQTSPTFLGERAILEGSEPFFYNVGRISNFWLSDRDVCENIGLIPDADWIELASSVKDPNDPNHGVSRPKGSMEILWPLYEALSLSQFIEVFISSLTGRTPTAAGITLLEHSLAFAEAEAWASRKTYRLERTIDPPVDAPEGTKPTIKTFKIRGEPLVPVEVLYISTISALSHITMHILSLFQLQTRYLLLLTSIYGLLFLSGFAISLSLAGPIGILHFPTISVVLFIPHLCILLVILVCASLYGMALLFSSFAAGGIRDGAENMRAGLTLRGFRLNMEEDFYTVLLQMGYLCLTAAAEKTYLNEAPGIRVMEMTWLETRMSSKGEEGGAKGKGPFTGELIKGVGYVAGGWVGGVWEAWKRDAVEEQREGVKEEEDDNDEETEDGGRKLYQRFLEGRLPETDESADYAPSDTGSESSSEDESADEEYERQRNMRETTPLLDMGRLAALLDPQTAEDRSSAKLLARHLSSKTTLTRRRFSSHSKVSNEHEESELERIILSRRKEKATSAAAGASSASGSSAGASASASAEDERMLCVVCKCEPRTVIVWPCRCLCLCDDCRVCLAMNNWSSCITCRVPTTGYSRVYVP